MFKLHEDNLVTYQDACSVKPNKADKGTEANLEITIEIDIPAFAQFIRDDIDTANDIFAPAAKSIRIKLQGQVRAAHDKGTLKIVPGELLTTSTTLTAALTAERKESKASQKAAITREIVRMEREQKGILQAVISGDANPENWEARIKNLGSEVEKLEEKLLSLG